MAAEVVEVWTACETCKKPIQHTLRRKDWGDGIYGEAMRIYISKEYCDEHKWTPPTYYDYED